MDLRRDPPIFKGSLLRRIPLCVVELVGGLEVERLERWIGEIVERSGCREDSARIFQLARLWSGNVLCGGCKRTQEKNGNQNLCAHDSERLARRVASGGVSFRTLLLTGALSLLHENNLNLSDDLVRLGRVALR